MQNKFLRLQDFYDYARDKTTHSQHRHKPVARNHLDHPSRLPNQVGPKKEGKRKKKVFRKQAWISSLTCYRDKEEKTLVLGIFATP